MWPWGHLAVGYLLYSVLQRRRDGDPGPREVYLLAIGTLVSDLVDKPLAWTFGVLESGRSLGHSVLVAALVVSVLFLVVAPRIGRAPVAAFSLGYLSHPIADLPFGEILAGEVSGASYLAWPLLPPPPYETEPSFIAHLLAYDLGAAETVQLLLFALAVVGWYRDGTPGLAAARRLTRVVRRRGDR